MVKREKLHMQVVFWHCGICVNGHVHTYTYYFVRILDLQLARDFSQMLQWSNSFLSPVTKLSTFVSWLTLSYYLSEMFTCLPIWRQFFFCMAQQDGLKLAMHLLWLYHRSRRGNNLMLLSVQPEELPGTSPPLNQAFDFCHNISGWVGVKQNWSLLSLQTQRDRPECIHKKIHI